MVTNWRLEYLSRSTVTAGIQVDEMQSICLELLKLRNQISPPVPEIKLPSINRYEKYLGTLAEEAWRDCIVEVKRLNGLAE